MDPVSELRLLITVDDYDEALTFYRDVLGLPARAAYSAPNGGRVVLLDAGHATVELADTAQAEYVDEVEVGRRVAGHFHTPWNSLNARLTAPDGLQLTLFEELDREALGPE